MKKNLKSYFCCCMTIIGFVSCSQQEMQLSTDVKKVEDVISIQEASEIARVHYQQVFGTKESRSADFKLADYETIRFKSTRSSENQSSNLAYYVLNFDNDEGFAIVSALKDDNTVYAVSNEGHLHLSDTLQNPSLSWYINDYLQYAYTSDKGIVKNDSTVVTPPVESVIISPCQPLLKGFMTQFNQRSPYNKYCYTVSGEQAVIGCVPLAVGTLMGYHGWPQNIEDYKLDMNEMQSDSQNDGWKRLFEVIGRKQYLNANYGVNQTSVKADSEFVAQIINKLGYKNAKGGNFDVNTIYPQLSSNRLVLIGGMCSAGGHMWILDGGYILKRTYISTEPDYQLSYYLHCIWGWNGTNNGYFLLQKDDMIGGISVKPDSDKPISPTQYLFGDLKIVYDFIPNK